MPIHTNVHAVPRRKEKATTSTRARGDWGYANGPLTAVVRYVNRRQTWVWEVVIDDEKVAGGDGFTSGTCRTDAEKVIADYLEE